MKEGDRIDVTNGMGQIFEASITVGHKKTHKFKLALKEPNLLPIKK
jgi:hypothetical protein